MKKRTTAKRHRGFSLIELLIVVAIILILAAIAIPNFLKTRMNANEASAVASLKAIGLANASYHTTYDIGYAGTLNQLGPPSGGCATVGSGCADLLDSLLSGVSGGTPTAAKNGYEFTYYAPDPNPTSTTPNTTYAVVATPLNPGVSGKSTFCYDNEISIYKDSSGDQQAADETGCEATWPLGGTIAPL